MYYKTTESLLAFIKKSPTAFQATAEMEKKFAENGYQLLSEQEYWKLQPGGKYIVTRNHSALIAFSIPKKECRKFHIIASHSDSPAFKIKENPEMRVENALSENKFFLHCSEWLSDKTVPVLSLSFRFLLIKSQDNFSDLSMVSASDVRFPKSVPGVLSVLSVHLVSD